MSENTKFNSKEINIDRLIDDELTQTGKVSDNSSVVDSSVVDFSLDSSDNSSEEKNKKSVEVINAESIENLDPIILGSPEETATPVKLEVAEKVEAPVKLEVAEKVEAPVKLEVAEKVEAPVKLKEVKEDSSNYTQVNTVVSQPAKELNTEAFTANTNNISSLQTAEYLSIAQDKILELQKNIESLHEENANVASAGELWKQRSNKAEQNLIDLKNKYSNVQSSKDAEQKIFTMTIDKQNKKMEDLKNDLGNADILSEEKLNTYKLISSDLENRIEIIEREKLTLLDGKNKFISDLQKQINTLQKINTNDKKKLQQVSSLINEKEQTLRSTIKLLRQILISLEVGDTENSELSLVS